MIDEIINSEDLKKLLNVTGNKLTRMTKQGLPCVWLGDGKKVFLRDSLEEWLKSQQEQQGRPQ